MSTSTVCLISLGFRMVGRYGLWNNSPDPTQNIVPLTQALMTFHCSKEVELFGWKYVFPIDRQVNCSSASWRGRNTRTALCTELAGLEKEMKMRDVDGFDHWRTAPSTLRKICRRVQNHYVLLKSGFFVLGRINGTWQKEGFDFQCPVLQ